MENKDRLMTLHEVAEKMRLRGKPENKVRRVRKFVRDGVIRRVVHVSPHMTLVREGEVDQAISFLEDEGTEPLVPPGGGSGGRRRIARVVPRQKAS